MRDLIKHFKESGYVPETTVCTQHSADFINMKNRSFFAFQQHEEILETPNFRNG